MSGGEWTTQRERKQLAKDSREEQRRIERERKRTLRDLRYVAEHSTIPGHQAEEFWLALCTLHNEYGKEGLTEFWDRLVPSWEKLQRRRGGATCPEHLRPLWAPRPSQVELNVEQAINRARNHRLTLQAETVLHAVMLEESGA